MPSAVHLLTFGGGPADVRAAAARLGRQAKASGFFDGITIRTDLDLAQDTAFQAEHGEFVARNPRGYGYWIWKPFLLMRALDEHKEGDVLFYCDAGCEINALAPERFGHYVDLAREQGCLLFRLPHLAEHWTKGDLLAGYPELIGQGQIMATMLALRVGDESRALMRRWYDLCRRDRYHNLDDSVSRTANHGGFVEHRHDQACLTAAASRLPAAAVLRSAEEFQTRAMLEQPVLLLRNRKEASQISYGSLFGLSFMLYGRRRLKFCRKEFAITLGSKRTILGKGRIPC